MRYLSLAIVLAACGGHPADAVAPSPPATAAPAAPEAAPAPAAKVLTEATIPLTGGANALWWDLTSSTLYLTDSNADALLQWTDRDGIKPAAQLPPATAGISLGGIVRPSDGSIVIASFGYGKEGTLFVVDPDRKASALTGLDPTRRRIGLAQDRNGALYSAYFVGHGKEGPQGGVSTVTITGGTASETEIAGPSTKSSLHKPVGLVATPHAVYVADQAQLTIFKIAIPGYAVSELAHVPSADLMIMLPRLGDLLTGGGPTITRISQRGEVTPLPLTGFEQVRGLAYDSAGKRLFVIDHSQTAGVPDKLRIVPFAD